VSNGWYVIMMVKKLLSQVQKQAMSNVQVISKSIVRDMLIIVQMIVWEEEGACKITSVNVMMVSQVATAETELI